MAIYLDANVLWSWRTFAEVDRLALSIVAQQTGQAVYVPEIAAREAAETYRRSLEDAVLGHERAAAQLNRTFVEDFYVHLDPVPSVADAVDAWQARLALVAETLPTDPNDAVEAFNREIVGRPPTKARVANKPGSGARDAAIWLAVLRHHRTSGEPGAFVTKNSRDFATDGALRPQLVAEVEGFDHPLTLYLSPESLIETLGIPAAASELTLTELRTLAEPTLRTALRDRPDLPPANGDDWSRTFAIKRGLTRQSRCTCSTSVGTSAMAKRSSSSTPTGG